MAFWALVEPAPEPEPESEPKPEPETKPAKVAAADDAGSAMTKKQLLDHLTAFYDTHAPGTKTASALSKAAEKHAGKDLVKLDALLKKKFGETLTEFIGKCTIVWDASTAVPVPDPKSESTSELEPEPEGFIEVEENAGFGDFEGIADLAKLEDIGTGAGGEIEAAPAAVENGKRHAKKTVVCFIVCVPRSRTRGSKSRYTNAAVIYSGGCVSFSVCVCTCSNSYSASSRR